jgi:integrase
MKGLFKFKNSANWWFRYTPPGCERVQVGLKTADEAVAITRARAILGEGIFVKPTKTSLDLVIDRYILAAMNHNRKPFRATTAKGVKGILTRFIRSAEVEYPFQITIKNVQSYFDLLRDRGRSQDTLSSYARDICAFSRWMATERLTSFYLVEKFERPQKSPKGRANWVRREVVAKLIETATDPNLKFILYCGFHAGLRKAEICAARVGWFDLSNPDKPVIHVQIDNLGDFNTKDEENATVSA